MNQLLKINMNPDKLIKINNVITEKVYTIKYLGFLIDKSLNFKKHSIYPQKNWVFKRVRNKVSILMAINIYNPMIKPHF